MPIDLIYAAMSIINVRMSVIFSNNILFKPETFFLIYSKIHLKIYYKYTHALSSLSIFICFVSLILPNSTVSCHIIPIKIIHDLMKHPFGTAVSVVCSYLK